MAKRDTIASHFREPKRSANSSVLDALVDPTEPPLPAPPVPTKPITIEPEMTIESFDIPIREKSPADAEPGQPHD